MTRTSRLYAQEDLDGRRDEQERRLGIERHEIALEPHWFRVQTERIKRCNSQAKKDY
ncbi:BZ3501_MvSof-1269-A2-R1_Chr12-3g03575 [Microbotryum saponariae]|nr:BZ3501_MvSof-1269-A2-R1_Chr12-3g03575 [Microbotryum saponariae]